MEFVCETFANNKYLSCGMDCK